MTQSPESPTLTRIALERLVVGVQQRIGGAFLRDSLRAESYLDALIDDLAVMLRGYVLADRLEEHTRTVRFEHTVDEPASWWQMLKRDHFPGWLLARFPIQTRALTHKETRTVSFAKFATFPEANVTYPKELGRPIYVTTISEDQ